MEEAGKFILIKDNPMTDNVKRFGVAVAKLKRLNRVLIDREGVDFQVARIRNTCQQAHVQFVHAM